MSSPISRLTTALAERYRIEREVGQGGMATVYLAHDLKHDRDVALKVLHPELGAVIGAERFLQEIKTTARLQHPHILGLIDSGEADGLLFYVMPFVSGESLRSRLTREKQLPIPDALRIATEVASALDYAHRQNVVHRDIKPENVLLHDGQAMVADFGIALAVTAAGGGRITQTGMSLGTPHYMSPEQALGEKEITPRADIYALGAMTYEMLTGDPPFTGSTAQAVLSKVMTEKPLPPSSTRETVPAHVEIAVLTALAKLPADRWGSAKEFADALANPALTTTMAIATGRPAPADVRRWKLATAGLGAALVLLALLWILTRSGGGTPAPPPAVRFTLQFARGVEPTDVPGSPIAFSRDGSRIAFVGTDTLGVASLYVRALDQPEPSVVPGTRGALVPFFSPDGGALGFWQDERLKRVPLAGGPLGTIVETPYPAGAVWGADDGIIYSETGRLMRVSATGGAPEVLAAPDSGSRAEYRWPELTEDGRALIFTLIPLEGPPELAAFRLEDRRVVRLEQQGMSPHAVEGGYLSWVDLEGTLHAAPFDGTKLRLTGAPRPILEGVRTGPARVAKLGMARTGALAFLGGGEISRELVAIGRDGRDELLPIPKGIYEHPRYSPDGRRIALRINYPGASLSDVWVYELVSRSLTRLTFDSVSRDPEWTPDGRHLLFLKGTGRATTLFRVPVDGSTPPESLLTHPGGIQEVDLGRDGRTLVFRVGLGVGMVESGTGQDLWYGRMDSLGAVKPFLATRFGERGPALSPSGALVAYSSNESGKDEVYVRQLREGGSRWKVSRDGGTRPRWAPSGRELYFVIRDSLYAASIAPGADPQPGPPRGIAPIQVTIGATAAFDVSPDGSHFLQARFDLGNRTPGINVLLHWFDQLRSAPAAPAPRN